MLDISFQRRVWMLVFWGLGLWKIVTKFAGTFYIYPSCNKVGPYVVLNGVMGPL